MLETKSIKSQISTTLLLVAAHGILMAGCAKIADPQPPEIHIPKPASDLVARQFSGSIVLTVSKPEWNTNGSPATLEKVEVFRFIEGAAADRGEKDLSNEQALRKAASIVYGRFLVTAKYRALTVLM